MPLEQARLYVCEGKSEEFITLCETIISDACDDVESLLSVGALLLGYGHLSKAQACFEKVREISPQDLRSLINLANLYREAGKHHASTELYIDLLRSLPDHPILRRNFLIALEYDPGISDDYRFNSSTEWGMWAIKRAGGIKKRPRLDVIEGRKLRIGYVSADFAQHTVGLFVKDILEQHNPSRVTVFTYSAGNHNDWVTEKIRSVSAFRDISGFDDDKAVDCIKNDRIDILIDLSGHTAGSRLSLFAYRPAPVLVSWLGYFATTGLEYMDAVLLDEWHAPEGMEHQFTEEIIRLPMGRFCYTPVPFAPDVSPLPSAEKGYITFGSFNNTAKYNDKLYDTWSEILHKVPKSRLVLKWRTFVDEELCRAVKEAFAMRGVDPERIELRGASFHVDVLKEYADIDIALDPFPFTGGLTSCESLWMGIPVVTWPQSRVVSRQTFAFLSAIGLSELSAESAEGYIRLAVDLAQDQEKLYTLRRTMRSRMESSPLMEVAGFTAQIEETFYTIFRRIYEREKNAMTAIKSILHIGPGHRDNGAKLPSAFLPTQWHEIRLDIDPLNEPDIIGSMLDMKSVANESVDAIYSSHNIEHVYAHEVPIALNEFLRVLKPDGFLLVTCPDLQSVCALAVEDKLTDPAYNSPAGAITPLDILYGHGAALAQGHHFMAHKCGFTLKTLTAELQSAGFASIAGMRRVQGFDLWIIASKSVMDEIKIRELAKQLFPL